eukprot:26181_1
MATMIVCAVILCGRKRNKAHDIVDNIEKQEEKKGYNALDFIANISDKKELSDIGITIKGHQTQIIIRRTECKCECIVYEDTQDRWSRNHQTKQRGDVYGSLYMGFKGVLKLYDEALCIASYIQAHKWQQYKSSIQAA